MNKIAVINSTSDGSTGQLARKIIESYEGEGRLFCFYGKKYDNVTLIKINRIKDIASHSISRIDGKDGFHYKALTKKLVKELEAYKPDIIHLHNLHGYYLNMPILFDYINKNNLKVIWTFHDFYPLTGRCAVPQECELFLNGCNSKCPNRNNYPYAIIHKEHKIFLEKKKLLSSIKDLKIVTPSNFLAEYVKKSYLNKYDIEVIHNGIDLNKFKYKQSDLKEKLGISKDKIVLLDVMLPISVHKGIAYINKLANELDDQYQILLIGRNDDNIPLSKKIIHIPFVKQEELHLYYSIADLFINTTISDNYPTVDMEAIACFLPVVSFDTGGSKEIVTSDVGKIVTKKDYESFKKEIELTLKNPPKKENFSSRRNEFDEKLMVNKYIKFYR